MCFLCHYGLNSLIYIDYITNEKQEFSPLTCNLKLENLLAIIKEQVKPEEKPLSGCELKKVCSMRQNGYATLQGRPCEIVSISRVKIFFYF